MGLEGHSNGGFGARKVYQLCTNAKHSPLVVWIWILICRESKKEKEKGRDVWFACFVVGVVINNAEAA